jgi:Zn-dependent M28 family amino/carboxypeptidase
MFANMPIAPKRSIIFVALTGEDAGMLGSQYFASFPTVAKGSIVANVNLDMPILLYDFSSIIAYGAEHSSIKGAIESAAKSANVKMIPDPYPEQNNFTRSDHYSFVEQGIPSVYLDTGTTSFNPNENVDEIVGNFLANTYHKPSDDLSQNFNWKAMGRFTEINFRIGLILANDDNKPSWNEGNYFGEKFAQDKE